MKKQQIGFTLVEVLVSLLIFSFGMLGVAMQMSEGLKSSVGRTVHNSVMHIALQSIEPLKQAVEISNEEFQDKLKTLNSSVTSPPFANSDSQLEKFTINITSAKNENLVSLLDAPLIDWAPPFTIVLKVTYEGNNDVDLSFFSTHVLVPPPPPES